MNINPLPSTKLRFTIIVIEIAGGEVLEACINAIQHFDLPCVAILREKNPRLEAEFSTVLFDVLQEPVPLRRKRGVDIAKGDVVVIIEDTTIPDDTLLEGLAIAFEEDECIAASGPVAIDRNLSERYQALACTEYGRFHSTKLFPDQRPQRIYVDRLPGNFICYRRNTLHSLLDEHDDGLVEGIINDQLLSQGKTMAMVAKLSTTYSGEDRSGARLGTRFHHGWIYAGGVAENKGVPGRMMQSLKSLLLPLVLSLRAIRFMSAMKEISHPVKVAIWICSLELFWSTGELVGSIVGKPDTMEHWH